MELPKPCASGSCEQRFVVRFLVAEKILAKNIAKRLKNVYGEAAIPSRMVRSRVEHPTMEFMDC